MDKASEQTVKIDQPLTDSYSRRIDYLRISVTDKCNLKCLYCMPSEGVKHFTDSDILTDEEIVRFVRIAHKHGLEKVRITGGEPLVRKNITQLIAAIKAIGIRDLSLTTNGIMLSKQAEELKKAGLNRVNISLDSLDAERFGNITKGGDISLVWESIKEAERVGLVPVKINMVPIRGINDDEIAAFASLTLDNDYHIRFIELMPSACNGAWRKDKYVSSSEIMEKISKLGKVEEYKFKGRGPSRNYRIKGAAGVIGIISPISEHFCSFCNRLRLTADGNIRPCLFSNIKIDIKNPMRKGASDEEIEALFLSAVKVKPQRHLLNEDINSSSLIDTMSKIGG
ncbi:MAG: GTP 3',8-cyclase MoaA [Thermodesulfovibrionia bacterium]|nr:GTP 3',8-cyclase MoaA [Thermodesulfovibrionia bacterium]